MEKTVLITMCSWAANAQCGCSRERGLSLKLPAEVGGAMLHITTLGTGKVERLDKNYVLTVPAAGEAQYSDAQIGSYRSRDDFNLRPPLRMTLRARVVGQIHGTA